MILWIINNKKEIIFWIITGFLMMFLTTFFLFIFVDIFKINLLLSTFITAELSLIIRFLINDKMIFKSNNAFGISLLKFHIASASGFIIWWSITNLLSSFGIYYLYSSIIAVFFSTLFNFSTNFFWIWKKNIKIR